MTARPHMSEEDLLRGVVDLAQLLGLLVHHSRPARSSRGWVTAIVGDVGLPDLVIAGRGGVLFRELKTARGRLSVGQILWLARLELTQDAGVWRPEHWPDRIRAELEAIR